MRNSIQSRKEQGFTIIEVLIVLAIAGLIMLVVFLAIPALQRNQRNSGRQSDASRIATAVNDYITDSQGTLPTNTTGLSAITGAVGNLSTMPALSANTAATAACTATQAISAAAYNISICTGSVAITGATAAASPNHRKDGVLIVTGAQCNGTNATTVGSGRQSAILYLKETPGNASYSPACINI